ncbi:hypothetical protein HK097_009403 [Rhizophlyctis rosea]|uniref:Protein kinase domain-containing protein n=1 Tax=Rhizophlyctis rosea TaxID=64517 RepID=A0AAD5SAK6_9FUNG|nr:hypothetical protein HK097_009403 [Rhizophlyctis rosea]
MIDHYLFTSSTCVPQITHCKGIVHCDIKTKVSILLLDPIPAASVDKLLPFLAQNILAHASRLETDADLTSFRPHLIDFVSSKFWPPPPSLSAKKKRRRHSATKIGTTTWVLNMDGFVFIMSNDLRYRRVFRYADLNLHKGKELSPRDDIESLLYLLIDLHNGKLPWSGDLNKNMEKDRKNQR